MSASLAELKEALALSNGLLATKYLAAASLACVVYDSFLLLEKEFRFIWRRSSWDTTGLMYLLIRYCNLAGLLYAAYAFSGHRGPLDDHMPDLPHDERLHRPFLHRLRERLPHAAAVRALGPPQEREGGPLRGVRRVVRRHRRLLRVDAQRDLPHDVLQPARRRVPALAEARRDRRRLGRDERVRRVHDRARRQQRAAPAVHAERRGHHALPARRRDLLPRGLRAPAHQPRVQRRAREGVPAREPLLRVGHGHDHDVPAHPARRGDPAQREPPRALPHVRARRVALAPHRVAPDMTPTPATPAMPTTPDDHYLLHIYRPDTVILPRYSRHARRAGACTPLAPRTRARPARSATQQSRMRNHTVPYRTRMRSPGHRATDAPAQP
ncbi:hypothetical protein PsYK624_161690 [Phanerochaete sordida]|uniref:DUF6533 domain-containing protein n=1 Tax=Phanerochaete sordida TaxID=48140 RepID=A0A9P3LMN9_9APHY|nr:hypothetical protein PsYK624_161690 [Phanerochaete sordida]